MSKVEAGCKHPYHSTFVVRRITPKLLVAYNSIDELVFLSEGELEMIYLVPDPHWLSTFSSHVLD